MAVSHPDVFGRVKASLVKNGKLGQPENVFKYSNSPDQKLISGTLDEAAPPLGRVPLRTGGRMARITSMAVNDPPLLKPAVDRQVDERLEELATGAPLDTVLPQFASTFQVLNANTDIGGFLKDPDQRVQALQRAVPGGLERMMAHCDPGEVANLARTMGPQGPLAAFTSVGQHLIEHGTSDQKNQADEHLSARGSKLCGSINRALEHKCVVVDPRELPDIKENREMLAAIMKRALPTST